MNKKILILGKGYIGQRIHQEIPSVISAQKIYSYRDLVKVVSKHKPAIIINCIGDVGGNNVDGCEDDVDRTLLANTLIPLWLAEVAYRTKVKIVHISTGCSYHYDYAKDRPISEEKPQDYLSLFYTRTKIYAERSLTALLKEANILVLRIRVPLDDRPHPRNLLTKLLRYQKVINEPNSITYIPDFIKALKHLIHQDARGVFHVALRTGVKFSKILDEYKRYHPEFQYQKIGLNELSVKRTSLILSTKKLAQTGFKVRSIDEVLKECIKRYVISQKSV